MPAPDEKSRAWTRPDDYWPQRRPARSGRPAASRRWRPGSDRGDPIEGGRATLSAIPFALLMIGFLILTVLIMVAGWPGRRTQPPPQAEQSEMGIAPKGWIDGR